MSDKPDSHAEVDHYGAQDGYSRSEVVPRGAAREKRGAELRDIEGDEAYEGQQTLFETASRLAAERRLSRCLFLARKR